MTTRVASLMEGGHPCAAPAPSLPSRDVMPLLLRNLWTLLWLASGTLGLILLVDAGSVALTSVSTPDRVHDAGRAAAQAVEGLAVTQDSAVLAFDAAVAASDDSLRLSGEDFRLLPDGRVRVTGSRTAPTLLIHHLPRLERFVDVTAIDTVGPLPYGSAP